MVELMDVLALVFFAYLAGVRDARKRLELDLLKGKSMILGQSLITVKVVK